MGNLQIIKTIQLTQIITRLWQQLTLLSMQAKLHQSMVDNIICLMEGCINKDQALKVVYLQCLHKTWEG